MSATRLLGLMMVSAWLLAGCSSAKKIEVGGTCILNSDCNSPLLCSDSKCHDACHASVDCPTGENCVRVGGATVCQLPGEATCPNPATPCRAAYVCASDLRCRTPCQSATDCAGGQLCVTGAAGGVCADPSEIGPNGQLLGTVTDAGTDAHAATGGAGGGGGPGGASGSSGGVADAATAGSGGATDAASAPGGAGGSSGGAGDAAGSGGTGGSGGPGGAGGTGGGVRDAGSPDLASDRPLDAAAAGSSAVDGARGGSGGGGGAAGMDGGGGTDSAGGIGGSGGTGGTSGVVDAGSVCPDVDNAPKDGDSCTTNETGLLCEYLSQLHPSNSWDCSCDGSLWSCRYTYQGGSGGSGDAGGAVADASTDGGAGDGGIPPAPCTTTVPAGSVASTTWTLAGSPYCVQGNLGVSLLTIEPGVEVLVDGAYSINVLTSITATGTAEQPILFSARRHAAPDNQRWQGLKFQNTPAGSNLSYSIIEYANGSGLTLTNSPAPVLAHTVFRYNSTGKSGGAISATGVLSNLNLTTCTFSGNSSTGNGGALSIAMGSGFALTIQGCVFESNTANASYAIAEQSGGALYLSSGDATITNCVFMGNRANSACSNAFDCGVTARGGAVWLGGNSATLKNNQFRSNVADAHNGGDCFFGGSSSGQGAAVYVNTGSVTLESNLLGCNTSTASGNACGPSHAGTAIYVAGGTVNVTNATIARNSSTGVHRAGGTLTVTNSIIYFNNTDGTQVGGTAAINYSDVEGGYAGGTGDAGAPSVGNITYNPAFSGTTCSPADLMLLAGSPAIDMGDPAPAFNDRCSPPGLGSGQNDMGAYGGPANCGWL